MIFRDESKVLLAKRKRKAGEKKDRPPTILSKNDPPSATAINSFAPVLGSSPNMGSRAHVPKFPLLNLGTSAEDQAMCFFFRNYVLDNESFKNGNFQYLSHIYANEDIRPALGDCIAALGMAGLANFWKAGNIMARAHTKYTSAVRLVGSMLQDIDTAKSDQTLVAVMLLGLYEVREKTLFTCSLLTLTRQILVVDRNL